MALHKPQSKTTIPVYICYFLSCFLKLFTFAQLNMEKNNNSAISDEETNFLGRRTHTTMTVTIVHSRDSFNIDSLKKSLASTISPGNELCQRLHKASTMSDTCVFVASRENSLAIHQMDTHRDISSPLAGDLRCNMYCQPKAVSTCTFIL